MHNPFTRTARRSTLATQARAIEALQAAQAAADRAAEFARASSASLTSATVRLGARVGAAAAGTGALATATRWAAPVVAPLARPFAKPLLAPMAGSFLRRAAIDDLLAGGLSTLVLAWRGRRETGSAAAPINAPSHWFFGDEALRRNAVSWRYTGVGTVTHFGSALLWALVYRGIRVGRRTPTPVNALTDAAAVTAVAAFVDLKAVPDRLTPGFQKRLSDGSLVMVYGGFALGLAIGGWLALRSRR